VIHPDRSTVNLPWRLLCLVLAVLGTAGCAVTPQPLSDTERIDEAQADRLAMFADQEPLRHPLTLHEAFDRAIKYNLDARVKAMEAAVALQDLDLANFDMLPKIAVNAAATTRSNPDASSSTSVLTNRQTLEPSTSTDRTRGFADLTLSWNVLDFGVSYFNARQAADRTLIAEERRRKVLQGLLQDVRRAYWRAAAADRLGMRVRESIRAAEAALPTARKVETEGLKSPIDSLRYQKALLDLLRQLEGVQQVLETSKIELASLINLPPGQRYRIALAGPRAVRLPGLPMSVARMEDTALLLNPDIRESSYNRRITRAESHKALLRLFPGFNLTAGPHWDSNSFLFHNQWVAGAAYLNGYLNSLLLAPTTIRRAGNNEILADVQRQAISMAVLTKLHIAAQQYMAATKEYRRSAELSDVDQRLYQQVANRVASDAQGELERVSAQVSALYSDLRKFQSFAEAQAAIGRLYAALGVDEIPGQTQVLTVLGLNEAIDVAMRERAEPDAAQSEQGLPPPEPEAQLTAATGEAGGVMRDVPVVVRPTPVARDTAAVAQPEPEVQTRAATGEAGAVLRATAPIAAQPGPVPPAPAPVAQPMPTAVPAAHAEAAPPAATAMTSDARAEAYEQSHITLR
jgi:outer membrane protein TolC